MPYMSDMDLLWPCPEPTLKSTQLKHEGTTYNIYLKNKLNRFSSLAFLEESDLHFSLRKIP